MSIKKLILVFISIILPLTVLVTVSAIGLKKNEEETKRAQISQFESYKLAEELLNSSELLTRFARTYVVTGDPRFKNYFQNVLDIRNGKIALPEQYNGIYWHLVTDSLQSSPAAGTKGRSLEDRLLSAGITNKEFSLLEAAHNRSNNLVSMEAMAMKDVDSILLRRGAVRGQPSAEMLIRQNADVQLLHSKAYHHEKAAIMQPIGEFHKLLEVRTSAELQRLNDKSQWILTLLLLSSIAMLVAFLFFAYALYNNLLKRGDRLLHNIKSIANGNLHIRSGDSHHDELGIISNAVDGMADKLISAISDSKLKAELAEDHVRELAMERNHSEKLLNNILPALIADRLKKGESHIAETFPEVTVLFADLVGFTRLSSKLPPRQLVNMLNDIFGQFDELATKYKLEKIKTIGDCYMVVGGVPDRSTTHCQQVADFALEALTSIYEYDKANNLDLHLRIGIHTGTVVAGIVGKQKYSYDLWGDVVNVASRMESTAATDHVHVTEAVRIRLSDDYEFEDRGEIELKGKGLVHGFHLLRKKHH
jgi:class 3 adenylate cyclase